MPLAPGTVAPDFTLKTKTEEGFDAIALSAHRNKDVVVLLFFPAAFTSVCTQEMCDATNGVHDLQDAVVYGISADLPHAQEAWAKANAITVKILSDHDLSVTKAYDVLFPDFAGFAVAARAAYVIDRRGVVTYAEQTPTLGDLPDFTALQLAVESAVVGKL